MSSIPTTKIQTGPDTFIVVNTEDAEAFKFMEYVPKVKKAESISEIKEPIFTPELTAKKKSSKDFED